MNGHAEPELTAWLLENADRELSDISISDDVVRRLSTFRRRFTPEQACELSQLWELRRRGSAKYRLAHQMFFTPKGLEQGTDQTLATFKGERWLRKLGTDSRVVDLGCGLGGDALGWCGWSAITLVERDPQTLAFARRNLEVNGIPAHAIHASAGDLTEYSLEPYDGWHLDPDRRPQGKRRSDPMACDPPLFPFLQQLPRKSNWGGGVKLSPAAQVSPREISAVADCDVELEWIGHRRECQQLVVWLGTLADQPGAIRATWIEPQLPDSARVSSHSFVGNPADKAEWADSLGDYLYEPQAPVRAARLSQSMAVQHGLSVFSNEDGYLTGPRVDEPLLQTFRVHDVLPYRAASIVSWLQSHGGQALEIKHRLVPVNVPSWHAEIRQLQSKHSPLDRHDNPSWTILVTLQRGKPVAIMAERIR